MKSRGGKKEYLCPKCRSKNIHQITMTSQKSGACDDCDTWWPWSDRIKEFAEPDKLERSDQVEIRKMTGLSRIGLNNV